MKNYLILALIVLSIVLYGFYSYEKNKNSDSVFENTPLPTGVKKQIVQENGKLKIKENIKNSSGTVTAVQIFHTYPESNTTINIKDDDSIEVDQNIWGLCLRPAFALDYAENINMGISVRFLFYRSFGAVAGINYDIVNKEVNLSIAADYRLNIINTPNISVFVGYNSQSKVIAGINFYFN